jgi:hypothetical protein
MSEEKRSFGKWHLAAVIVLLYTLVVLVTLLTNQPADVHKFVLNYGAGAVGGALLLVFIVGD